MKTQTKAVVNENNEINKELQKGLTRHLIDSYLYGFENLENEKGLLALFLKKTELSLILEILRVRYNEYYQSLPKEKKGGFEKKILDLWEYLIKKYNNLTRKENFLGFLPFVPQLDESYIKVILKSISPYSNYDYHRYLEYLIRNSFKLLLFVRK